MLTSQREAISSASCSAASLIKVVSIFRTVCGVAGSPSAVLTLLVVTLESQDKISEKENSLVTDIFSRRERNPSLSCVPQWSQVKGSGGKNCCDAGERWWFPRSHQVMLPINKYEVVCMLVILTKGLANPCLSTVPFLHSCNVWAEIYFTEGCTCKYCRVIESIWRLRKEKLSQQGWEHIFVD